MVPAEKRFGGDVEKYRDLKAREAPLPRPMTRVEAKL